jgi:D-sedoheptulose 7-phosphate isomerase
MIEGRTEANERFFDREAHRIAELSLRMAERFVRGGRLLAVGASAQDWSDAHHVAVEFVHPVIVGKRALPALALDPAGLELLAADGDMVIAFGVDAEVPGDCLTIGFTDGAAEWTFVPPTDDPFVRQELVETLYHVLWETVHVFLEHLGSSRSGAGSSAFLYPFLEQASGGLESVQADVARSVRAKAAEVGELRRLIVGDGEALVTAAAELRGRLAAGGTVLAFGNGGSATDAMDVVADFRAAPHGWPALRALDLTADAAVLTALANDVGAEVLFARQLAAHSREGDVALAFSTSGGSANILAALAQARRSGLTTIAVLGYDGGRIAAESLADHVLVAPSEYVPRIQEAHATAYHLLRELVETGGSIDGRPLLATARGAG